MTTEQLPPQTTASEQPWGTPAQRPPQRWSSRKTVAAVAIAVGVVAAGGAAIYAASGSSSSASSTQGGPGGQMGGPGGAGGSRGSAGSALSGALHGEYVVSDGNGGYTTELMQTGQVTAVDSTSLTAKSTDGFTKTYTIDSSTAVRNGGSGTGSITDVATGDTVTVVAKESGSTATANAVTEGSAQSGGPGGAAGAQQPDGLPARQNGSSGQGQG